MDKIKPLPMNAAMHSRPSVVSLKVWLRETRGQVDLIYTMIHLDIVSIYIYNCITRSY